ncbi:MULTISPECIES: tail completion protein gp17 [Vallitalea]|uniref:Uncharacterized protein n=1 Tax=Vallitalea maricola TaxID=3074433 RepID=A0ACB5UF68_9FIRM|nr:DUF3168 domain-containing protein [Vallitalea guaymasensis]GMQ61199.1 hypothetical protein AN2V17_04270 [Vallitalea sp. AN17-2]
MISLNKEVVNLLKNDADITAIVKNRIYPNQPPVDAEKYPIITYLEIDNIPNKYADNKVMSSKVAIQLDIWTKNSSSTDLSIKIDKVMFENKYKRFYTHSLSEKSTGIQHKIMRYRKLVIESIN